MIPTTLLSQLANRIFENNDANKIHIGLYK